MNKLYVIHVQKVIIKILLVFYVKFVNHHVSIVNKQNHNVLIALVVFIWITICVFNVVYWIVKNVQI